MRYEAASQFGLVEVVRALCRAGEKDLREAASEARFAMRVPADQVIVEIGSFHGHGLYSLAGGSALGNGAHIYGVDLWGLRESGQGPAYDRPENMALVQDILHMLGIENLVTLIRSDSVDAAKGFGPPVGLLVIDGDHRKPGVLADYLAWSPKVAPGGWLLMHDARNGGWPGVDEVITQVIGPSLLWEAEEFVEPFSQWFRKRR